MISIKLSRIIIVRVPNDNHPESFDLCLYAYDADACMISSRIDPRHLKEFFTL